MCVAHFNNKTTRETCKKGQSMKHFYTINYKLFGSRRNDENLIDVQINEKAYKTRENAFKAVQERIKTMLELGDYKPTRSAFVIETDESETDIKFRMEFEIKEHWLSEFEEA